VCVLVCVCVSVCVLVCVCVCLCVLLCNVISILQTVSVCLPSFPFILRQEKKCFQVKLLCYNTVIQVYCKSRKLADNRYVLIRLIFMTSGLWPTIGCDVTVTVTVQEISAQGGLESELSVN
jgi:hypothetical protein